MKSEKDVLLRASSLRGTMSYSHAARTRTRAIMDGGPGAVQALLGDMGNIGDQDLPWANLMLSGLDTLAMKLGNVPRARVNPPHNTDDEAPRKRAEKRERIVEAFDEYDRLPLQLPQVARWLPGYGFAVWTLTSTTTSGNMYPCVQLRDPYDCYPGEWGVNQQPEELAVCRRIHPAMAERLFPKYAGLIGEVSRGYERAGGGILLSSASGWENPSGRGLEIIEYYDRDGTHILLPQIDRRVEFHVNPLSGPAFVVAKRFAFNHLVGQYDQMIGLLGGMAKLQVLYHVAMEDNTFAPTNIAGELDGQYRKGRFAVNRLAQGSTVTIPQSNIPYQAFEMINHLERRARVVAGYPVQDDAQSPTPWATGAGLGELASSTDRRVEEYKTVIRYALQDVDAKRLEWDEMVGGDQKKPLAGLKPGIPHTESYIPAKDIKGDYRTIRRYGMMSGLEEPQKIIVGGQMIQLNLIDTRTLREQIAGLDNLTQIEERINDDRFLEVLHQGLLAGAAQNDPRAFMVSIEALPAGELKTLFQKYYTVEEPQMSEEELALAGMGQPSAPQGPPPDVTTVLQQLSTSGAKAGLQTVGRV